MTGESKHLREVLSDVLYSLAVSPIRVEHFPAKSLSVFEQIREVLNEADFVIADLTDANPNVMWEVGFAQALNKPVLLLVKDSDSMKVPFNVSGYLLHAYPSGSDGIEHLKQTLPVWIKRIASQITGQRGGR